MYNINELYTLGFTNEQIILNPSEQYTNEQRGKYSSKPLAMIMPSSNEQVVQIVKYCNKHKISIVPQGGNTSLCNGSITNSNGKQILLNMSLMNKILSINKLNKSIIVEAGCTLAQVQKSAIEHELLYPLSLPSEQWCTVGGNIATNAGGVAVLKYGNTRQLCLGLQAVMADGSIYDGLHSLYKNNAGYDLKHLFIGS
jgi:FAD/FMN-containing dehydrogenase